MKPAHYILTRFNLGLYDRDIDHAAWMKSRIKLFERYTLPSMMRQIEMDWTWVLCFDHRTPSQYLVRYDYMDNISVSHESPVDWMLENVDIGRWLITTRLDNDDYVESNFTSMIKAEFDRTTKVVDTMGRVLDTSTGLYYDSGRTEPNSMFLSLIEPGNVCKTCYDLQHTHMPAKYNSVKIPHYGWTMVVHGENLMNKVTQKMPLLSPMFQTLYTNG